LIQLRSTILIINKDERDDDDVDDDVDDVDLVAAIAFSARCLLLI